MYAHHDDTRVADRPHRSLGHRASLFVGQRCVLAERAVGADAIAPGCDQPSAVLGISLEVNAQSGRSGRILDVGKRRGDDHPAEDGAGRGRRPV